MRKYLCEHIFNSLGYITKSRTAGSHDHSMLNFLRSCPTVFHFTFPPAGCESSNFSIFSPTLASVHLSDYSCPSGYVVVVVLIRVSLTNDAGPPFHVCIGHLHIFTGDVSIQIHCPQNWIICLFITGLN